MVVTADKTNKDFWEDGLQQYFDQIALWSANTQGSIGFDFDVNINNTKYTIDFLFSYTTEGEDEKQLNALLSIKKGSKKYRVAIKDNSIFYMLDGYNAVERDVAKLADITQSLPFSEGGISTVGSSLRLAVKTDEIVKHGLSVKSTGTTEEYLVDIKVKETLDTFNRHLEDSSKAFVIDFFNNNFNTSITSLDKDDNQIDTQLPPLDIKLGYVATRNPVANMPNTPTEIYMTIVSPASIKPAFNGQAQDVSIVFKQKYKTLAYDDNTSAVLPLDTSDFITYDYDEMSTEVSDNKIVIFVNLLRNMLNMI